MDSLPKLTSVRVSKLLSQFELLAASNVCTVYGWFILQAEQNSFCAAQRPQQFTPYRSVCPHLLRTALTLTRQCAQLRTAYCREAG
jgi:hypothetical protein